MCKATNAAFCDQHDACLFNKLSQVNLVIEEGEYDLVGQSAKKLLIEA
jgi:hypothetical protein